MTENELLEIEKGYSESKIQHTCVWWFRMTFPDIGNLLFSVPNGGWRGAVAGARMVYEGQVKGVADLILLSPYTPKPPLFIEMKVPCKMGSRGGRQSEEQKAWQELVTNHGCCYVLCHGLSEFIRAVCSFLHINHQTYLEDALNRYPLYR